MTITVRSIADNAPLTNVDWVCDGASISPEGLLSVTQTGLATVSIIDETGISDTQTFACTMRDNAIFLPAALQSIDNEAFLGTNAVQAFVLPSGINDIGDYAFADCSGLKLVIIPASTLSISDTAFDNCPGVTIVCRSGSAAAYFAEQHNIPYLIIP